MEQEILLTGGRITQGVARRGDRVYRPMCANSVFPTEAQTRATHQWTQRCRDWVRTNLCGL